MPMEFFRNLKPVLIRSNKNNIKSHFIFIYLFSLFIFFLYYKYYMYIIIYYHVQYIQVHVINIK